MDQAEVTDCEPKYSSDVVIEEISRANASKKKLLLDLIGQFSPTRLIVNREAII
jgi:hypothetical protein